MKPIAKLYLRIFLYTGIIFGLLMMISDIIIGAEINIYGFLFRPIFFGVIMSVYLVYLHKKRLKKNGITEFTEEDLDIKKTEEVISRINFRELLARLRNDIYFGKMNISETESGLIIKTKVSWYSWGEIIIISVTQTNNEFTKYIVSSKPRIFFTLIDYGKNKENIERIEKLLN